MAPPNETPNDAPPGFSLERRVESFSYAFAGIAHMLRTQHNAWIHLVVSIAVVGVAVLLPLSRLEWCALVFAIGLVWIAEGFNTALESLADAVTEESHPLVGRAKDVAAGAVLIAAAVAAGVGLLVMGPHLVALVSN
ncbi:MAG: diacylglycerol kinase family protein [Myxococcota bacterium]|jgi:diacylglycerol kinase (ATP)|nr:diacylglycerol kinase family protein [Myxococcota bacterium]